MISTEKLAELRNTYKTGERVRLLSMVDTQAPPVGTLGTVKSVDDMGTVHISWDNGSSLGAVYGEDKIEIVTADNSSDLSEEDFAEICRRATYKAAVNDLVMLFLHKRVDILEMEKLNLDYGDEITEQERDEIVGQFMAEKYHSQVSGFVLVGLADKAAEIIADCDAGLLRIMEEIIDHRPKYYSVEVTQTHTANFIVRAYSAEEAEYFVNNMDSWDINSLDYQEDDFTIDDITEDMNCRKDWEDFDAT